MKIQKFKAKVNTYILQNGQPVPCKDILKWAEWFKKADRRVASTKNDIWISTVFLGVDHSFGGNPPILYETLVFGGEFDGEMRRYSTKEEAIAGHKAICDYVL